MNVCYPDNDTTEILCLQENIEVLQDERVVHRALMSHFTKYSSDLGRWISFTHYTCA